MKKKLSRLYYRTLALFQGGEPDVSTVAKSLLNDFQRGRLPYFTPPPGCEERAKLDYEQVRPIKYFLRTEKLGRLTNTEAFYI